MRVSTEMRSERLLSLLGTMLRIRSFEDAAERTSQGGVSAFGQAMDQQAAVRGLGDPVAYLEHKELWNVRDAASLDAVPLRLGQARVLRDGSDLTIVSWSRQVHRAMEAAGELAALGVQAEVIDLATLWPWDRETVLASAGRTGRLLVTHEAVQVGGFGAEIAASAAQETGCRVRRAGAPRIPVGYAPTLEAVSRVSAPDIAASAMELLR